MIWLHYVGGYYTRTSFLREARQHKVTRRVAANIARKMSYGDTVRLLAWNKGKPLLFAEFVIRSITMPEEIAKPLAEELIKDGKARLVSAGGGRVVRECGSYIAGATYAVDVELGELVEDAIKLSKEKSIKPSFMISGPLTHVYKPSKLLDPAPPFTRGFIKAEPSEARPGETALQEIKCYAKRTHKKRRDLQMRLC